MKKVGIITWHYIENYGSALQAYALQQTVTNLGFDVKIINYRKDNKYLFIRKCLRKVPFILNFMKYLLCTKRVRNFNCFYKDFFKLSSVHSCEYELENSNEKYDIYICGSDQIWSPNLLDPVYLLNFVEKGKTKISYSPSVVIDNFSEKQKELVKKYVRDIDYISVREIKGSDIIKGITGKEAQVVLDPTFLLTPADWNKIAVEPKIHEKYILCYFLGENQEHRDLIKELQKKYGYKIVTLPFNQVDMEFGDIIHTDAGPREFLGLVKNAEIVCTDSFHGMALSINYEKDFLIFDRFKLDSPICQNERIYNVLNKLNIQNRSISKKGDFYNIDIHIDYEKVNELLHKERNHSMNYLKKALNVNEQ